MFRFTEYYNADPSEDDCCEFGCDECCEGEFCDGCEFDGCERAGAEDRAEARAELDRDRDSD